MACKCFRDLLILSELSKEELKSEDAIIDHVANLRYLVEKANQHDDIKLINTAEDYVLSQLKSKKRLPAPDHHCAKLGKHKRTIKNVFKEFKQSITNQAGHNDVVEVAEAVMEAVPVDVPAADVNEVQEIVMEAVDTAPVEDCQDKIADEVPEKTFQQSPATVARILSHKYKKEGVDISIQLVGVAFTIRMTLDQAIENQPDTVKAYLVGMKARGHNLLLQRRPDLIKLFKV